MAEHCPNCGHEVEAGARFCRNCGQDLHVSVPQDERIPTESVNVPPPPPQSTGRRFGFGRMLLLGCGGLLALLVLVVVIAVALVGGNNSSTSSSSSSSSDQNESESASSSSSSSKDTETKTVGIGETATVGDSSWLVNSAYPTTQLTDQFGVQPPKQGNFVVVDFTFTNNGNEAKTLSTPIINLFDSSNRKSSPDDDAFLYIPQDKNIFINQVNPGVSKDGEVIFSVAPDASGFKLEVQDTNYFSSAGKADIDLGF